ncbi:hypothetical protein BJY00DRAFT_77207 [Aspergillus carlsbadensis]|nr:hypothetical protein BJY00DRAFT_77207 [Aspergillus carlsbadensis]
MDMGDYELTGLGSGNVHDNRMIVSKYRHVANTYTFVMTAWIYQLVGYTFSPIPL